MRKAKYANADEEAARLRSGLSAHRKMIRSQYLLVGLDDLDVMVVEEVTGGVVKCRHG